MKKLCIRWEEVEKAEKENHKKQRKHGLAKRLTAFGLTCVMLFVTGVAANNYTLEQVNYPIYIDDIQQTTDMPVLNLDGSTYVPLRFVGEGSGLEVNWDGDKNEIRIQNKRAYAYACYYSLTHILFDVNQQLGEVSESSFHLYGTMQYMLHNGTPFSDYTEYTGTIDLRKGQLERTKRDGQEFFNLATIPEIKNREAAYFELIERGMALMDQYNILFTDIKNEESNFTTSAYNEFLIRRNALQKELDDIIGDTRLMEAELYEDALQVD